MRIISHLRAQIVEGQLLPGQQTPTQRVLREQFDASPVTVQNAIDRLIREGFIEARGSRGTFVTECPPHLSHYAFVFHQLADRGERRQFWTALANEVQCMQSHADPRRSFSLWHGVDDSIDRRNTQRLIAQVESRRLAGLIFTSNPDYLSETPLIRAPGIPRVAIMGVNSRLPDMPRVEFAADSFWGRAFGFFRERGRRRLGLIMPPSQFEAPPLRDAFLQSAADHGLEVRPYWQHRIYQGTPASARSCTHLLMRLPREERPDALFVTDDNLVQQSTAGLLDAGIRVPDELDVVTHCNFPWPTPSVVPAKRLGVDVRQVLRACIDLIDRQREGTALGRTEVIPSVFEEELADDTGTISFSG